MRFHFGVSFRPTKILKYIGLGFLGLLAFFGISKGVKADTIDYTMIDTYDINGTQTLACSYNSIGKCPTSLSNFSWPPRPTYGVKYIDLEFQNTQLTSGHYYTIMIQFHILHQRSSNYTNSYTMNVFQFPSSGLAFDSDIWNITPYYDSFYDLDGLQFNFTGSFNPLDLNSTGFWLRTIFGSQEAVYGVFIDSVNIFDNNTGEELIDSMTQNTIDIINSQNQNSQNIINNQNNNTNAIINNQNQNTQQIIDSQNELLGTPCSNIIGLDTSRYSVNLSQGDKIIVINKSSGDLTLNTYTNLNDTTRNDYWSISAGSTRVITLGYNTGGIAWSSTPTGQAYAFEGSFVRPYCKYGSYLSKLDDTNQNIQQLNDTISDDSIDTSSSNDFFDNFSDNHHGLSGIVSLPLTTIQSLNNASCSPLTLTIPYLQSNNTLQLPCLTPIYEDNFGVFFTLYQTIIFGFVSYYVCISIFYMVKDFKDPNKDKIEVMDL